MEPHNQAGAEAAGQWLGQTWAAALAGALDSMTGEVSSVEWMSEPVDADSPAPAGQMLWWEQGFDLTPEPAVWVGIPEETWTEMARRALRAAGVEEPPPEEARRTCLEILSQSFSALAQAMGQRTKRTVIAGTGRELEQPPDGTRFGTVRLDGADTALAPILAAFGELLAEALEEPAAESAPASGPDAGGAGKRDREARDSQTLDLLRGVELPVSVSFGRTRMPLQDVLRLTPGSVVELDRSIDEPVELIVNDTVVALGEVVVIEGNYGLRIQRIMGREKLLRSNPLT
ncbi:MAG: flagellar motor switch protein FliN [Bryobacterales bacterium]|nr:flagellar motor switch protein FliN [Bryobacterales bacterium]